MTFLRAFFRPRDEWVIFFLAIFMLFIAGNTQTGWLYVVVAVLVALLVVGFVLPRVAMWGLEVETLPVPAALEGDDVGVRVRIKNDSSWTRYLFTVTVATPFDGDPPRKFVLGDLPSEGVRTFEYRLTARRRGVFFLADVEIGNASPLGLFPVTRRFKAPTVGDAGGSRPQLVVYPKGPTVRRVDFLAVTPRSAVSNRTYHRAGQSYDFQGIRPYAPGDDTRFVHWPTTARTGALMIREFRELGAQQLTILLDNAAPSGVGEVGQTPLDEAARLAASLIAFAQMNGASVTLVAAAPDSGAPPLVLHNARGIQALDWLARLEALPPENPARWVDVAVRASPRLDRKGLLMVLAADGVDEGEVRRLAYTRLALFVMFFSASDETAQARRAQGRLLTACGAVVRHHRVGENLAVSLSAAEGVVG